MKTVKQFGLMLTMVLAAMLSSCSGDDNGGGGGGSAAHGTITAKVQGASNFKSMEIASWAQKHAFSGGGYMITIGGSDASGRTLQLILFGADGNTGTWTIGQDTNISAVGTYTEVNTSNFTSKTWAAPYDDSGDVGSITITSITDTNIKGSFTFKGKNQDGTDTKSVTNGAFNVDFQN